MRKSVDVNEGFTMDFVFQGSLLILLGVISLFFIEWYSFIPLILGALLLAVTTGVEVDLVQKRIRSYYDFFGLRLGKWHHLKDFNLIYLKFVHERDPDNLYSDFESGSMFQAVTFDLCLRYQNGKSLMLYEYIKYPQAKKALNKIIQHIEMEWRDTIEEAKHKVKQRYREFNS